MQGKAKSVGMFVAGTAVGLALGTTVTYKVIAQPLQNIVADQYVNSVRESIGVASRLRREDAVEVIQEIDSNIPNNVQMLHQIYPGHRVTPRALRDIKTYYEKHDLPVPAEIQPILSAVK